MKEIRIFAFAIGGYYTLGGLMSTIMFRLIPNIRDMYETLGVNQNWMYDKMEDIQKAYAVASPWLIPIGIGFLAFGWFMPKITSNRIIYLSILSVFSLMWAMYSCVYISPILGHIYDDFPLQNDMMKDMGMFIQIMSTVSTLAQFTLPQFFMGREIIKFEQKEKDLIV